MRLSKSPRIVASRYKYQFIGTEHFLYGIADMDNDEAKNILLSNKGFHRRTEKEFDFDF